MISASSNAHQTRRVTLIGCTIVGASFSLLTLYVPVYQDQDFGITVGKSEPAYHLLLRRFRLIDGGKYSTYPDRLDPLLENLRSSILIAVIVTVALIAAVYGAGWTCRFAMHALNRRIQRHDEKRKRVT